VKSVSQAAGLMRKSVADDSALEEAAR
jgi:hypothetical protein